jgi:A/G-specific adenine glycosylase
MEFGAIQCKPVPDCRTCPLNSGCLAFQQKIVNDLPVRSKKQSQRTRYFHYLIITAGRGMKHTVFLKKRTGNDIWKNLFDFPLIEKEKVISHKTLIKSKEWQAIFPAGNIKLLNISQARRHILTHQIIVAKFYHIEAPVNIDLPFLKINLSDISKYPLPRLIDKYILELSR